MEPPPPAPRAATHPGEDGLQPRVLGSLASCRTHVTALAWGRNFLGRGAVCTMLYPPDGWEEGSWEGEAMPGPPGSAGEAPTARNQGWG